MFASPGGAIPLLCGQRLGDLHIKCLISRALPPDRSCSSSASRQDSQCPRCKAYPPSRSPRRPCLQASCSCPTWSGRPFWKNARGSGCKGGAETAGRTLRAAASRVAKPAASEGGLSGIFPFPGARFPSQPLSSLFTVGYSYGPMLASIRSTPTNTATPGTGTK